MLSVTFNFGWSIDNSMSRMPSFIVFFLTGPIFNDLMGLSQLASSCIIYGCFSSFLLRASFTQSQSNDSMFIYQKQSHKMILLVYIDDIILTGSSQSHLHSFIEMLVGVLQYLTMTHPDISHDVQYVSQFVGSPTDVPYEAMKRILHYLRGTLGHGLPIRRSLDSFLIAYSEVHWVGCLDTHRSTTGCYLSRTISNFLECIETMHRFSFKSRS